MGTVYQDITGKKFNLLTVLREAGIKKGSYQWECLCDCGNIYVTDGCRLRTNRVKSCGCTRRNNLIKTVTKHGLCYTNEYKIWTGIKYRILNKKRTGYHRYGGRGIKLCERWTVFENFLNDMGPRPSKDHSVDRINNNGDYEPENCRWATRRQQNNNTRKTINFTINGRTLSKADWAREAGIKYMTLDHRLRLGWSIEEALRIPIDKTAGRFKPKNVVEVN